MAYATAEDRAFFKEKGWIQNDEQMHFYDPTIRRFISANWFGKMADSLDVPKDPNEVIWIAVALAGVDGTIVYAVDQEQRCQSPRTAYVLAEVKQWTE